MEAARARLLPCMTTPTMINEYTNQRTGVKCGTDLIAASPKDLLRVCMTQRFAYSGMREAALEPVGAKSI